VQKALPLYEHILAKRAATLGADHPDTLRSMNNLAVAYQTAGQLQKALPLYEQTLAKRTATLGADHPDTLTTMNNLASAYLAAGQLQKALPLLEDTLAKRTAKQGADHPDTLRSLANLAATYWSAKKLDKSIPLLEDAVKRHEAKFGRDHLDTVLIVALLGLNYKDAGRLQEAVPLLEEAYRAAQKYPQLRGIDQALLDAYAKVGATAKLANVLQEQLAEARKTLPKDSPQLAARLAQLGLALLQQNKGAAAEALLRECLAIRQKTQPEAWTTCNTQSMLGGALLEQKKYAEAEPLLLAGYEGMKKQEAQIPPQGKVRLTEAVQRVVQLYEATGNQPETARWRKVLEALSRQEKNTSK
jgi:tetratricopeptide (TPR) repeat protein